MMKKLIGWMVILVMGNVIWLSLDKNPPAWDQAAHLKGIVLTNWYLTGQFWGGFVDLIRSFWGYPPLVYFIGGIWSLLVGPPVGGGIDQISFLNTIFLLATVWGVYKLSGNKLLPVILFSLFPVIVDISRNLLLDLALTAWVTWGLYFWLKRNDWGMLLMLILASLTKLNGFMYFAPLIINYLWESRKSEKMFLRLVVGGLIYLMAVGWWWVLNSQNIYAYLTGLAGSGEVATDPMNLSQWLTWIHYFKLFFLTQLGPITALLFLIFAKKENKKLIWWVIATYVIFTVIKNKDFRFTMPILPVIAVWFGWGLEKIKYKWIVGLILLWMGFNYVENSFNWPIKKPLIVTTPTYVLGDVKWVDWTDYPVREVRRSTWPNEVILTNLPDENVTLLVVMNIEEVNDNTLGLYRLLTKKMNIDIQGVDKWGIMKFDYILVPDEATSVAPFYDVQLDKRNEVVKTVWNNQNDYELVNSYNLPNKGNLYLFRVR